jgi:hypothetical protein
MEDEEVLLQLPVPKGSMTQQVMASFCTASDAAASGTTIFATLSNVIAVHMYDRFLAITLKASKRVASACKAIVKASQPDSKPDVRAVTKNGWTALLKAQTQRWRLVHERIVMASPLPAKEGFSRVLVNGRWLYWGSSYSICNILHSAKSRTKRREHIWDELAVLLNFQDAFSRLLAQVTGNHTSFLCQCRPSCAQPLHLAGEHTISPDRGDDTVGYGDKKQIINIVSCRHNVPVKCGAIPKLRKEKRRWECDTAMHAVQSTSDRMTKVVDKQQTPEDAASIALWRKETQKGGQLTKSSLKAFFLHLKETQPFCGLPTCPAPDEPLFFGHGVKNQLTHSNVWQQASPDRFDAMGHYVHGNCRLVHRCCQLADAHRGRIDREEPHSGDVVLLRRSHVQEILKSLAERIKVKNGGTKRKRT